MGAQGAKQRELPARHAFPVIEAVAGFGNVQNLMAFSGNNSVLVADSSFYSNATTGVSLGATYVVGAGDYDPEFVQSILQADAAAPEARFNNVVDMLDWLNH
jgi:hypothetical protein